MPEPLPAVPCAHVPGRHRMGRQAMRALAAVLCLAVVGPGAAGAACAQPGPYVGGSVGQGTLRGASAGQVEQGFLVDDGFVASGTRLDRSDRGWKAYVGQRFSRFLGVEAGYADLGRARFDTTIVAAPAGTVPAPPFGIRATATARGPFAAVVVHVPVSDGASIFARGGAFRGRSEFTEVFSGGGGERLSRSVTRTDALFGAGLQWAFDDTLGVRLEWERFRNIGRGIGGREGRDVDVASVGLFVQF